jgi:beta-glucanase (GH16 family)
MKPVSSHLNSSDYEGSYEAQIKASAGFGIVTSFITISDDGNEIDFEILGKKHSHNRMQWKQRRDFYNEEISA